MADKSNKKKGKPKTLRTPAEQKSISTNQEKILFSFQYLDSDYGISECEKEDQAAFSNQLQTIGSRTWQELQQAPKHGQGFEKIKRHAINYPIPKHLKDDESVNFLAFRFSSMKAMVGYREREIFHVIWIDRDFSVYKH